MLLKIVFSEAATVVSSQQTNTCSKPTIETQEEDAKYVQI